MQCSVSTIGLAKAMGEALQRSSWATFIGNLGAPLIRFPIKFWVA